MTGNVVDGAEHGHRSHSFSSPSAPLIQGISHAAKRGSVPLDSLTPSSPDKIR